MKIFILLALLITNTIYASGGAFLGGGGGAVWGSITGVLSSQTDLQTALNAKANILANSTAIFNSSAGYGSIATKVPYFANQEQVVGTDITVTSNDSTNGLSLTINTAGWYAVNYIQGNNNGAANGMGLSLNASSTSTAIGSLTATQRIASISINPGFYNGASATLHCNVNDVIRPQDNIELSPNSDPNTRFSITRIQ